MAATHKLSDLFSIEALAMGVAFCSISHLFLGVSGLENVLHGFGDGIREMLGFDPVSSPHDHGHNHGDFYSQLGAGDPDIEFEATP